MTGPALTQVGPATKPSTPLGRLARVALVGAGVGVLAFAGLLPCPTALLLHLPCPGCGLTRATRCLLQGDLAGMLRFHPLAPLVLLFLAIYLGGNAAGFVVHGRGGLVDERIGRVGQALLVALVGLMLGLWVARFAGWFGGPVAV